MTGPERKAAVIARGTPRMPARRLAKLAGVPVDVARRVLEAELERRKRVAS